MGHELAGGSSSRGPELEVWTTPSSGASLSTQPTTAVPNECPMKTAALPQHTAPRSRFYRGGGWGHSMQIGHLVCPQHAPNLRSLMRLAAQCSTRVSPQRTRSTGQCRRNRLLKSLPTLTSVRILIQRSLARENKHARAPGCSAPGPGRLAGVRVGVRAQHRTGGRDH